MLTLVLVRHAKSDWSDPGLDDHDRPLNQRGRSNAPYMASRLATTGVQIDRILSSTATRARTTAAEFAERLGVDVELDSEMYMAPSATLTDKAATSGVNSVMLVAHDPGITYLAERLSGGEITHMPTCAVAVFSWNADDWGEVAWNEPDEWTFSTPRSGEQDQPQPPRTPSLRIPNHRATAHRGPR